MAQARQVYEGSIPVARMRRLASSLASTDGDIAYVMSFDRGPDGRAMLNLQAAGQLALVCQRSLDVFLQPVEVDQQFGVVATESDEAALLPDVEPLLSEDGMLDPVKVIEDELILSLPLIPVKPGAEALPDSMDVAASAEEAEARPNPFEALRDLKGK